MISKAKRLSVYARIALLALVWQLIALPLSTAMAASGGLPGEVPVCTASGIKWVKVGEQTPAQQQDQQRHCPLCVTGQGGAVLLDSHAAIAVPVSFAREARASAPVFVSFPFVLAAPPPARAPPVLS